jgi:hypothetical protein
MTNRFLPIPVLVALAAGFGAPLRADPLLNTGGLPGVSRTLSTSTLGEGCGNFGISGKVDYDYESIHVYNPDGTQSTQSAMLYSQDLYGAVGISDWLDMSVDMPFYEDDWSDHTNNSVGAGDLSVALKAEHPGLNPDEAFRVGYYLRATLPTGMSNAGYFPRHSYDSREDTSTSGAFSVRAFAINPEMLWTLDFNRLPSRFPLLLHANAGGYLQLEAYGGGTRRQHTSLLGNLAAEYALDSVSSAFLELSGETKAENLVNGFDLMSDWNKDILRVTIGGKFQTASGINGTLGLDFGLSDPTRNSTWARPNDQGVVQTYTVANSPTIGVTLTLGFARKDQKPKAP